MTSSNLQQRIADVFRVHQAGQFNAAEISYRQLLAENPGQVDLLYLLSSLLLRTRPEEAADLARRAVEGANGAGGMGVPQAILHDHYAACLFASGAAPELEAEQLVAALELDPGTPERLFRLAEALRRAGDQQRAMEILVGYLQQRPGDLDARTNLGALQMQLGLLPEAIGNLQEVIKAKPNHPSALHNLGNALLQQERVLLAQDAFQRAVHARPDFPASWYKLATVLQKLGRMDEALPAYRRAVELKPGYAEAVEGLNSLYVQVVPRWHFVMMNDRLRNEAYDKAIRRQVARRLASGVAPLVLDIGAGSGLLAMMAARAGAAQVVTCEMVVPVAEKAREIIAGNGYTERVTLHGLKSTCLAVGKELPRRAEILVSEILDVGLLGEHVLPTLAHARRNLLAPDATIIPARATVWMMPLESKEIHELVYADNANSCGFDFEGFNLFSRIGYEQLAIRRYAHRALAAPLRVLDFDFTQDIPDRTVTLEITPSDDGLIHAWAFWFTLHLDDETSLDIGPYSEDTCWAQAVQVIPTPLAVKRSNPVRVEAIQTQFKINFEVV